MSKTYATAENVEELDNFPCATHVQDNVTDVTAKDVRFWNVLALISIPLYLPVIIGFSLAAVAAGGGRH